MDPFHYIVHCSFIVVELGHYAMDPIHYVVHTIHS